MTVIVDAGPLVAYFNRDDALHDWARTSFSRVAPPLLTCEAAITEATYLLARDGLDPVLPLHAIVKGGLSVAFSVHDEIEAVRRLMGRYDDIPCALADACLVRMSELYPRSKVLTFDRDFLVYRRNKRERIPLIAPFES